MTDQTNQPQEQKSFEELIASYEYQMPEVGQVIQGILIRLDDDGALVDIGVKRDALVPSRDLALMDKDVLANLHAGDKVVAYVTNLPTGDQDLQVSLSKGMEYHDWLEAEKLKQNGEIVDLPIIGHNRGGMIVQFMNLRGFLPFSQVPELRQANNPHYAENVKKEMVGKNKELKVIEVSPDRNRLIFSALEAQAERRKKRLEALHKGQVLTGKVASLVDFGAFVNLDGIDGLVHISQLDWKKVKHPSELLKIGDEIQVKVLEIDMDQQRVSLSRKSVLPSPWENIGEVYKPGDYVEVVITRIVEFGSFARLPEGVEGLIHASQIGYSSVQNPKDAVKTGDRVLVKVLEIHPERRRMALSMRQVPLEKQMAWSMDSLDD